MVEHTVRQEGGSRFESTHWSVVQAAGSSDSDRARCAWEVLCRDYWYPLYGFIRRQGYAAHDAEDLTQEFLAGLMRRRDLRSVSPDRGRFRTFLLAALKHFLSNRRTWARALKRGGGVPVVSIDQDQAESRLALETAEPATAAEWFDREWAQSVLQRALSRLRGEYAGRHKTELFDSLKPTLAGAASDTSYAGLDRRLGMTPGALKVAVHRLRRRYREVLRDEIAQTVLEPADLEDEMRYLAAVLAREGR